jgi:hypothetical protein
MTTHLHVATTHGPARAQEATAASTELLTPEQLAQRLQLAKSTVYNHLGQWDEKDGVVRLGPRCTRINWPVFFERLMAGKISLRAKP